MKPSLRDPHDGWWSPEFRAWLRAYERGALPELLEELLELAGQAGRRLELEALARDEARHGFRPAGLGSRGASTPAGEPREHDRG